MNTISFANLIKKAKKLMEEQNYTKGTITQYSTVWNQYYKYCYSKKIYSYTREYRKEFVFKQYGFDIENPITRNHKNIVRKLNIIDNISKNLDIFSYPKKNNLIILKKDNDTYNAYLKYLYDKKYSEKTIINRKHSLKLLLNHLQNTEIKNIQKSDIYNFINNLKYKLTTKTLITENTKYFLNYLFDNNIISFSGNEVFPVINQNKRSTLISYYTKEEIVKILNEVDVSTKSGKRDYLILLLAIELGIRISDIIKLKLNNINWHKNKIVFEQNKTKTIIELPLLENIKLALCDYLKNARPQCSESYIFVRLLAPHIPMKSNNMYYIPKKYILKANVQRDDRKQGLHSMRHSLASNLLLNNTPLPVITGILGHSSINTTSIYLSIDINNLKKLSLEVPSENNR